MLLINISFFFFFFEIAVIGVVALLAVLVNVALAADDATVPVFMWSNVATYEEEKNTIIVV
jgi:hypothetical protein